MLKQTGPSPRNRHHSRATHGTLWAAFAMGAACGPDLGEDLELRDEFASSIGTDQPEGGWTSVGLRSPAAPGWRPEPFRFGYFDHTDRWYRGRAARSERESLSRTWGRDVPLIDVVLYNDIPRGPTNDRGEYVGPISGLRERILDQDEDIQTYLDEAASHGRIRVLVQIPSEIVFRWNRDAAAVGPLLDSFVVTWRNHPALSGFYLMDEPILNEVPVSVMREVYQRVKATASRGRDSLAISVVAGEASNPSATMRGMLDLQRRSFDHLLVNRYPIFRSYAPPSERNDIAFEVERLGLTPAMARAENLRDNEFANMASYLDYLRSARTLPNLGGRKLTASTQAWGLRDDCAGPDCQTIRDREPRRSPTWTELLNLTASAWMENLHGATYYAHYFSLYDVALRERLTNMKRQMPHWPKNRPVGGPGIALRKQYGDTGSKPDHVRARYVPEPYGRPFYYAVLLRNRLGRETVRLLLNPELKIQRVREIRFDAQGNVLSEGARSGRRNGAGHLVEVRDIPMHSYAVRILKLHYDR